MKKTKKIIWRKYELKYEHHKNIGTTLILVHGFNSSKDFANPFLALNTNFNIYTVDLPGSKYNLTNQNISIEIYSKLIKKMLKKLRLRKVILFGYSMGGAVVSYASKSWRVQKVVYLCPFHPHIYKNAQYITLKKHYYPQNKKEQKQAKLRNKWLHNIAFLNLKKVKTIQSFISKESLWSKIVVNNFLNMNYLQTLSSQMNKTLKKARFIISKNDPIIETPIIIEWLNSIQKKYVIIGEGHSPLIKNAKEIAQYIEKQI